MALSDVDIRAIDLPLEKAHEIVVAGISMEGNSRQLDNDGNDEWTPDDAIQPPLDLDKLAKLSETSGTRSSIIEAMARNTVGLGYDLVAAEDDEEDVGDVRAKAREAKKALEAAASRDLRMDRPGFIDLLYAVKTDEEECGNGYIEVSRDAITGKINGLFHAPGVWMRRLRDRSGYVMIDRSGFVANRQEVRFWNFGDKCEYDDSGQPTKIKKGKGRQNEILSFRLYTSQSRDYGLPRDAGLALEYLADKLAAEFNISFFDSGGTPPTVIFVQGEETRQGSKMLLSVPQSTVERIGDTLTSDGRKQKRVAIIPLPAGAKPTVEQLGQVAERDMGFVNYRTDNVGRFLGAWRMSPIFIAHMADSGRYDAEVQRALTLEQVFDPEQVRWETRLTASLVKDLGFPNLELEFSRMAVESDSAKRDSADKMGEAGTISVREHRKAHGYAPLPEGSGKGQYPAGTNDALLKTGQPPGAENRTVEGDDQRGLKPDVGERKQRSTDNELKAAKDKVATNGKA